MEIDQNEFSNYILKEILEIKARTMVLRSAFLAFLESHKPDAYEEFSKQFSSAEINYFQDLVIGHPFLKDEFDDLVRKFSTGKL